MSSLSPLSSLLSKKSSKKELLKSSLIINFIPLAKEFIVTCLAPGIIKLITMHIATTKIVIFENVNFLKKIADKKRIP